MKLNKYISMSLILAVAGFFTACTEDEIYSDVNDELVSFSINVNQEDFLNSSTRATENGFSTAFVDGDSIGIFAVRSGSIVSGIDNHLFVYEEGEWVNQGDNIEYLASEFNKMTFWAYYPYSEDVKFDPTAEDPFATYITDWTVGVDQSGDNYTKYDLMTSTGEVEGDRLKGIVYFTMKHRMALALIELPQVTYTFTNTPALDPYIVSASVGTFTLYGEEAEAYYQESTDTYRFLVKPDANFTIDGTYVGKEEMKYSISGNLEGGTATLYEIDGSSDMINMELEVGDYITSGGLIQKASVAPADAIAVVYYIGNTEISVTNPDFTHERTPDIVKGDALLRDYPNCTHGLAVALTDANDGENAQIGHKKAYSSWFYNDAYPEWAGMFVTANTSNSTSPLEALPGRLGYNNTALLFGAIEIADYEAVFNASGPQIGYDIIKAYQAAIPTPASTTPWIMPSLQEWDDIYDNLTTINESIGKVATEDDQIPTSADRAYWTSNERNDSYNWISDGDISTRERDSTARPYRLGIVF